MFKPNHPSHWQYCQPAHLGRQIEGLKEPPIMYLNFINFLWMQGGFTQCKIWNVSDLQFTQAEYMLVWMYLQEDSRYVSSAHRQRVLWTCSTLCLWTVLTYWLSTWRYIQTNLYSACANRKSETFIISHRAIRLQTLAHFFAGLNNFQDTVRWSEYVTR